MAALPTIENVASRFAPYIEELHELFSIHRVAFGGPDDLTALVRRLEVPGAFQDDVSSILRSIILREGGTVPHVELLEILAVAVAGPQIDPTATATQPAFRKLLSFVASVTRRRWDVPPGEGGSVLGAAIATAGPVAVPAPVHAVEPVPQLAEVEGLAATGPGCASAAIPGEAAETESAAQQGRDAEAGAGVEPDGAVEQAGAAPTGADGGGAEDLPREREVPLPVTGGRFRRPTPEEEVAGQAEPVGSAPGSAASHGQELRQVRAEEGTREAPGQEEEPPYPIPRTVSYSTAPLWLGAAFALALIVALGMYMRSAARASAGAANTPTVSHSAVGFARPGAGATTAASGGAGVAAGMGGAGTGARGGQGLGGTAAAAGGGARVATTQDAEQDGHRSGGHSEEIIAEPTTHWYVPGGAAGLRGGAGAGRPAAVTPAASGLGRSAGTLGSPSVGARQPLASPAEGAAAATRPGPSVALRSRDIGGPYFQVSSGVMASHLLSDPDPDYPMVARLAHVQGEVILQAVISTGGEVVATRVMSGHRLLRGSAVTAVRRWRYRPYVVDGKAVTVSTIVTVDFHAHR